AAEQVDAVEAGVAGQLADLRQDVVELPGQGSPDVRVGGLLRLADQRLGRLHQLGDGGDAVVGGLDGVDGVRHRVQQRAEVAGAVVEALGGEEVDGVVERRIDPLARGQLGLGGGDQVGGPLQLQQVRPDARRENDLRHLRYLSRTGLPYWQLHVYTCRSRGSDDVFARA